MLEAIAIGLEAIVFRLEAIALVGCHKKSLILAGILGDPGEVIRSLVLVV